MDVESFFHHAHPPEIDLRSSDLVTSVFIHGVSPRPVLRMSWTIQNMGASTEHRVPRIGSEPLPFLFRIVLCFKMKARTVST